MDWEAPRDVVMTGSDRAPRPLFQVDPRELVLHGALSLPKALMTSAAIFAVLMGLYAVAPTRYAAKAVLTVDPRLSATTDDLTPGIGRDSAALESLSEVALTDGFLLAVARQEKLADDPEFASSAGDVGMVEKLRSALTVDRLGTTYVFEVHVRSREADKAARLANAIAAALVERVGSERTAVNDSASRRLSEQVETLRMQVATSEKAAADYRARMGLVDAGRDATAAERTYSDLSRQVADASNALQSAKSRLDELSKGVSPEAGALDAIGSPLLTTLRGRLSDLRAQIAESQGIYGDRHPQIQRLQDRLTETRQQLTAEGNRLKTVAKADFDVAQRRYDALAAALAAAKTSVADVGTASADLSGLELKAKADRDSYEAALSRYQKAIAGKGEPDIEMRLTSEALPPIRPTKRTLGFIAPIAAGLALPLGVMTAMGLSLGRRRVRTPADVETLLDMPVVGVAPKRGRHFGPLTRLLVADASLEDCAALVGRVALERPGAQVLVAAVDGRADAAAGAAHEIRRLLGTVGMTAAIATPGAPAAAAKAAKRSWFGAKPAASTALAETPRSDLTLLTVPPGKAYRAGAGCDAAVLLVPWNGLSGRDLREAVNAIVTDPRTPAMVVFTI